MLVLWLRKIISLRYFGLSIIMCYKCKKLCFPVQKRINYSPRFT